MGEFTRITYVGVSRPSGQYLRANGTNVGSPFDYPTCYYGVYNEDVPVFYGYVSLTEAYLLSKFPAKVAVQGAGYKDIALVKHSEYDCYYWRQTWVMANYAVGEAFDNTQELFEAFAGMSVKWNIKYIPINCSLTGQTTVSSNTQVNVTVNPYPQAQLIGTSVYYSGGVIQHTFENNTLTFTTPFISE